VWLAIEVSENMRVLHLTSEIGSAVRLQRFIQSNLNMGITPIVFHRAPANGGKSVGAYTHWFPDHEKVTFGVYTSSELSFFLDRIGARPQDPIGLKKFFFQHNCQIIHAHSPESAYYSYKLGLPTIFDDWEYWLDFYEYCKPANKELISEKIKRMSVGIQAFDLPIFRYILKKRYKKMVLELIQNIPIIVTNEEVKQRYRELGASDVWVVPNVPLTFERNYGLAVKKPKKNKITTCYIGNMTADDNMFLRNTSGVRELWQKNELGDLYVFEGLPHLDIFRKVQECHFNLLFWKPLEVHRFYLQNKAFLASVMGVPTIISSSLKATIKLLGDYALPVDKLSDIPDLIKSYDFSKEYSLNRAHLWEYYEPQIQDAYSYALKHFSSTLNSSFDKSHGDLNE
jgi:hypothetical protein